MATIGNGVVWGLWIVAIVAMVVLFVSLAKLS